MILFLRRLFSPDGDGQQGGSDAGSTGQQAGATVVDEQPSSYPDWLKDFPEETHKDPNWTKHQSREDFVKYSKERDAMIGKKGVILPDEKTSPEDREKFLNALGRPEKPEGYRFTPVENLNPEFSKKITPEFDAALSAHFHKAGLTQQQADAERREFVGLLNQAEINQEKALDDKLAQTETALRSEWTDKYDANIQMITKGIVKAGGQAALDAMGGMRGLGGNPVALKIFQDYFAGKSEDQIRNFGGGSVQETSTGGESKEQAVAKINQYNHQLINDPKSAYADENHTDHDKAVQDMARLYRIAYPNES